MFKSKSKQNGFTFIEIAVAAMIFVIVMVGIFSLTGKISQSALKDKNRIKANELAQQLLEQVQANSGAGNFLNLGAPTSPCPNGNGLTDPNFPKFTYSRTIGPVVGDGQRDVNVSVFWEDGARQSDYYFKVVQSNAPTPPAAPPTGAILTGIVVDENSAPIEGATVWGPINMNGNAISPTTTGSDGRYTFQDVRRQPPQTTITVRREGSNPANPVFVQGYYDGNNSFTKSATEAIPATGNKEASPISLTRLSYITGLLKGIYYDTVTAQDIGDKNNPAPIPNLQLQSWFPWNNIWTTWYPFTNANGIYFFRNVIPGNYSVNLSGYGSSPSIPKGPTFRYGYVETLIGTTTVANLKNGNHAQLDKTLTRLGWLKLTVKDIYTGVELSGLAVSASRPVTGGIEWNMGFNSPGYFYNMYNYQGNFNVYATKTGYIAQTKQVSADKDQENPLTIELYPTNCGRTLTGTVYIDEDGDGTADRLATAADNVKINVKETDNSIHQYNLTSNDGTYTLNNVLPTQPVSLDILRQISFYRNENIDIKGKIKGYVQEVNTSNQVIGVVSGAAVSTDTKDGNIQTFSDGAGNYFLPPNFSEWLVYLLGASSSQSVSLVVPPPPAPAPNVPDVVMPPLQNVNGGVFINTGNLHASCTGFTFYALDPSNVLLKDGETKDINIKMRKNPPPPVPPTYYYIEGYVKDSTGSGVKGIYLKVDNVYNSDYTNKILGKPDGYYKIATTSNGSVKISTYEFGLPPNQYTQSTTGTKYTLGNAVNATGSTDSNNPTIADDIIITYLPGQYYWIEGYVKTATGAPVDGIRVVCQGQTADTYNDATKGHGYYKIKIYSIPANKKVTLIMYENGTEPPPSNQKYTRQYQNPLGDRYAVGSVDLDVLKSDEDINTANDIITNKLGT